MKAKTQRAAARTTMAPTRPKITLTTRLERLARFIRAGEHVLWEVNEHALRQSIEAGIRAASDALRQHAVELVSAALPDRLCNS